MTLHVGVGGFAYVLWVIFAEGEATVGIKRCRPKAAAVRGSNPFGCITGLACRLRRIGNQFINARATILSDYAPVWG